MSGATVGAHNRTVLTCQAEGNPAPKYQWLQKLPSQQVLLKFNVKTKTIYCAKTHTPFLCFSLLTQNK